MYSSALPGPAPVLGLPVPVAVNGVFPFGLTRHQVALYNEHLAQNIKKHALFGHPAAVTSPQALPPSVVPLPGTLPTLSSSVHHVTSSHRPRPLPEENNNHPTASDVTEDVSSSGSKKLKFGIDSILEKHSPTSGSGVTPGSPPRKPMSPSRPAFVPPSFGAPFFPCVDVHAAFSPPGPPGYPRPDIHIGYPMLCERAREAAVPHPKRKRSWSRAVFSNLQRKGLEKRFEVQKYVTKPDRRQLAAMLGLTDAQVKVWFQNRRMKWRRDEEAKRKAEKGEPLSKEEEMEESDNDDSDHDLVVDADDLERVTLETQLPVQEQTPDSPGSDHVNL